MSHAVLTISYVLIYNLLMQGFEVGLGGRGGMWGATQSIFSGHIFVDVKLICLH